MKVGITGINGFVGRRLQSELVSRGHCIVAVRLPFFNVLTDGLDCLVHLAADVGGIGYNRNNMYRLLTRNAELALQAVDMCYKYTVKMVAVGSVCAYPADTPVPFLERDLWNGYPEPSNAPYGVAKRLLLEACEASEIDYTYLLPANMYGPCDCYDPERSHVIAALIAKAWDAKNRGSSAFEVWGDGSHTRDFLYVDDCCKAIANAVEEDPRNCAINVGTGKETSILKLARMVAAAVEFDGDVHFLGGMPAGQRRRVLDVSRAKGLLNGWEATTSLQDGLMRTLGDYIARRPCGA